MTDRLDTMGMFVAVAELGSFAEAARRLNRDPAAVTRAVAALEADLRVRLLNRTTRSVALTDEGGRFLDGCRRLLASCDDLRALGDGDHEPHGAISVTTTGMFGRLHVLPSIVRFMERYPRVDVRAMFVDRIVSLVDEGLDVGVRLGKLPDSSLRATRVGQVYLSVYASPDYLARRGEPLSPRDLIDHQTVSCLTISPIPDRWSFDGAEMASVPVKPRLVVNSIESAADAVAEGAGLTFLASYHAQAYVQAGRLRRVLAAWEPAPIPIHILQPAGRFPAIKVRLFVDHLAADLRRRFASARRDAPARDSGSAA